LGFDMLETTLGADGRRAALSAPPATVQGPFEVPGGLLVLEVTERPTPEPTDPDLERLVQDQVRAMLGQMLVAGILERKESRSHEEGNLRVNPGFDSRPPSSQDTPHPVRSPFTIPSSR
jgi:hypothetical protein